MNCDQASTHLVDAITGNVDEAIEEELGRHLDHCAACREEQRELHALWSELGRLPTPSPPADATRRFADALSRAGAGASHIGLPPGSMGEARRHRRWTRLLALPAALAASLLIGLAVGRQLSVSNGGGAEASVAESKTQFLLLLREPASSQVTPAELRRVVAEYAAWARELEQQGLLLAGEKLADGPGRWMIPSDSGVMVRSGYASPAGTIGGYFVIAAETYEDAVRIARGCPHLRYGGEIEVRAIERV